MLELLFLIGLAAAGLFVAVGILKLLVALLMLPFKAAIWLTQGLVGLFVLLPLALIGYVVLFNALPIVLFALMLPVLLVAGLVVGIARTIF